MPRPRHQLRLHLPRTKLRRRGPRPLLRARPPPPSLRADGAGRGQSFAGVTLLESNCAHTHCPLRLPRSPPLPRRRPPLHALR
eukprot:2800877-Rhodomonas_salina.2